MSQQTPPLDLLGALLDSGSTAQANPPSGSTGPAEAECSRKGCRNRASWRLEWNNPRIHAPERRKTWLACAEHRHWLAEYLQSRGLLKDVLPLDAPEGRA